MVSDSAVSIDSTEARTGVLTLSVDAGLVGGAVSINLALWATVGRRSKHLWKTVALTSVSNSSWRFTVGSTRIRITRILSLYWFRNWWWLSAGYKWVSKVSLVADTQRDVIGNLTVGIGATQSWAWINTMKISALFCSWTVCIDDALWSTGHIGVSKVVRDTLTRSGSVPLIAHSIAATRRWVARVHPLSDGHRGGDPQTVGEWIPGVSRVAGAGGVVVVDRAGGVGPTHSWARVATLVADAGQVGGALGVNGALMSALHIGIALETGVTGAGGSSISFSALSIDATRTWSARINDLWSWCSSCWSVA